MPSPPARPSAPRLASVHQLPGLPAAESVAERLAHADDSALARAAAEGHPAAADEVALLFDVHGVAIAPAPIIRIAGDEAGRSGFPVLLTSIGVVLAF